MFIVFILLIVLLFFHISAKVNEPFVRMSSTHTAASRRNSSSSSTRKSSGKCVIS